MAEGKKESRPELKANEGDRLADKLVGVKWGLFFEDKARSLSYTALRSESKQGTAMFSGVVSVDGQNEPVVGTSSPDDKTNSEETGRPISVPPCSAGVVEALFCTCFVMLVSFLRRRSRR